MRLLTDAKEPETSNKGIDKIGIAELIVLRLGITAPNIEPKAIPLKSPLKLLKAHNQKRFDMGLRLSLLPKAKRIAANEKRPINMGTK